MAYLLDSNVFIDGKQRHYGFDFCPAFWDWIDRAHDAGEVRSIAPVKDELIGAKDELSEWVEDRPDLFEEIDALSLTSLATLSHWTNTQNYQPAAVATFLQKADYYLVGHAHAHNLTVVTHEVPSNEIKRVKIPNACVGMDVPYINTFTMLRRLKARFVLESHPPPQAEATLFDD